MFLYAKKPSNQATNKFSGMSYSKQAVRSRWLNYNKKEWKNNINTFKEYLENEIKPEIKDWEKLTNSPNLHKFTTEKERKRLSNNLEDSLNAKKLYSRYIKFYSYCYNDDYENLLKYHIKTQETMAEIVSMFSEKFTEGRLLEVSDIFKETYEQQKEIVEDFKKMKCYK